MKYVSVLSAMVLTACATASETPAVGDGQAALSPSAEATSAISEKKVSALTTPPNSTAETTHQRDQQSLMQKAAYAQAMQDVADLQLVFDDASPRVSLDGDLSQGGLVFGQTEPGAQVALDGDAVMVGADGAFVMGFGRDHPASALLVVTLPDGTIERRGLEIADREFRIQRIDGLDQSKVSGFTEAQLEKIAADSALKKAARAKTHKTADWADGFDWPVVGPISGVFGSQRILNGEPKRPHSGVDVAVPTGTPIRAPAAGIVRLAEEDMYFEGGLIFLDHGFWVESAFLHLSRIDVEAGQRVEKGDIIGAVGSTGRSTGPHLHWGMKWVGRGVDPQRLVGEMPTATN